MTLAHLVYRIAADPSFAAQFAAAPRPTLERYGLDLDEQVVASALVVLGDAERAKALCSPSLPIARAPWYSPERQK